MGARSGGGGEGRGCGNGGAEAGARTLRKYGLTRSHALLSSPICLPLDESTMLRQVQTMCGAGEVNGLIEGNITQNSREGSSNPPVVAAIDYVVEIHPPIVIENLLPHRGIFEIMHADDADTFGENQMNSGVSESSRGVGGSGGPRTGSGSDRGGSMASSVDWASGMVGGLLQGSQTAGHKRMLWCAELKHGESVPIHSVGLGSELKLLINLGFCRSTGEGALIHVPLDFEKQAIE